MKSKKAHAKVEAALDDADAYVKTVAAARATGTADDKRVAALVAVAKGTNKNGVRILTTDSYYRTVIAFGPRAKALAPELQRVRNELARSERSDNRDVSLIMIDEMLASISGRRAK